MIKTTILTGTEQEVTFAGTHTTYWVQNLGSGDILVGLEPELADGKDDVLIVPSGGTGYVRRDTGTKTVYLSGTGKAQVYGTNNAFSPFKPALKGGGEVTSDGGAVAGTVDYPLVALNLYGKSTQDTSTGGEPAGKNLVSTIYADNNTTVNNGVITQATADNISNPYVAIQGVDSDGTLIPLGDGDNIKLGIVSVTFTVDREFGYMRFGFGGSVINTWCGFYGTHLEVGKTYTIQANFTNITQGFISWRDIQIELGSTATTYEPYVGKPTTKAPIPIVSVGDDGNINVTACGKNLIKFPYDFESGSTILGITYTTNDDGSVTISGTTPNDSSAVVLNLNPSYFKVGQTYTVSGAKGKVNVAVLFGGVTWGVETFTVTEEMMNADEISVRITVDANTTVNNITIYPQIELGTAATAYEQYRGNTATITSGLPLCSIGEYRDELIYNADGTGKIIKQIGKHRLQSSANWTWANGKMGVSYTLTPNTINGTDAISDYFDKVRVFTSWIDVYTNDYVEDVVGFKEFLANNEVYILYPLATPQEITLSAAEMAELQKLQTFDGMTNIHNDEGAEMTVKVATNPILSEYMKPVIDGITARIENLEAAVLSLGSNV